MPGLASLHFVNDYYRQLPADPVDANYTRQVMGACYSTVNPIAAPNPKLVSFAPEVAALLDLTASDCASEQFLQVFSGNSLLPEMAPYACCYGGHQFGHWVGQLGDGRAINLGDIVNQQGEHWTLQLKGAGPTPYSRTADGLAVLRSSVREYLCSEAMHHLGVPTTRALSLITTGTQVLRDMFYDGNEKLEPGAVVCRVAPSFTRFGSFEIFAARGELSLLKQLVDFTIKTDFPEFGEPCREVYGQWFKTVCKSTAQLLAHWMRVGFVHGVMNTDNMSILGLTIDYGPYGWLEMYDDHWTPNTTDAAGRRYCFGNQPQVAQWNLVQLANAIYPLVEDAECLRDAIAAYDTEYEACYQRDMAAKLGFSEYQVDDAVLIRELQQLLQSVETDMTLFYRHLSEVNITDESCTNSRALVEPLLCAFYAEPGEAAIKNMALWLNGYRARTQKSLQYKGETLALRHARMQAANPKYVLRNYLAQQAIELAEAGDYTEVERLLEVLRHPYDEQPENQRYAAPCPDWARSKPGCAMLSCSS